jgi:hypothetical protein
MRSVWPSATGGRTIGRVMRLSTWLLPRVAPLAFAAFAAGCGGEHDAMEKQLAELHGEIARLRANQASLSERLDNLDLERGTFARGAPAASAPTIATPPVVAPPARTDRDRPELEVVRLSPSEGDGDADSEAPRPMIRAGGDATAPRKELSNKTISARSARKGVVPSAPKKAADSDARPVTKP